MVMLTAPLSQLIPDHGRNEAQDINVQRQEQESARCALRCLRRPLTIPVYFGREDETDKGSSVPPVRRGHAFWARVER